MIDSDNFKVYFYRNSDQVNDPSNNVRITYIPDNITVYSEKKVNPNVNYKLALQKMIYELEKKIKSF